MSAAQYRIVSAASGDVEDGHADVEVAGGAFILAPSGRATLRVPLGQISAVTEPRPFAVRVTLADETMIELAGLGAMRTQLLAELRDGRAAALADAAAPVGEAEMFAGTAGGDSAELRVYDDALLISTATATMRISFSFLTAATAADYRITLELTGRDPVTLARLGRRTGELADLLTTRLREARGRTAAFLASLLPGLDPMGLRAAAGLLRDGVAVPVAALDGIHPGLSAALLGIGTLPERQAMVAELARRTELAIGFKQLASVRRPAEGVTPARDHAVTPVLGDHGAPGGMLGTGLGGVMQAGLLSGLGPGGFGAGLTGGFGSGGGGGGFGGGGGGGGMGGGEDYWAFRALGAGMNGAGMGGLGMNGSQERSMGARADVTRGLLTPAREDLSALTASGDSPTVLAFALGRVAGDGRPDLVLYEELNRGESPVRAYQPDAGRGPDGLAVVNRALDDAGFPRDAGGAGGLASRSAPAAGVSPLDRWLTGLGAHDGPPAAQLDRLLATARSWSR